jgi:hypothetical protein
MAVRIIETGSWNQGGWNVSPEANNPLEDPTDNPADQNHQQVL